MVGGHSAGLARQNDPRPPGDTDSYHAYSIQWLVYLHDRFLDLQFRQRQGRTNADRADRKPETATGTAAEG